MPSRIGRYEIVRLLGRGGMGQVYLARDPRLGRDVALKVLPPEYATDAHRLERFRREARVASALNHPHICTIHDIGEEAGRAFIVMECVEGDTLKPAADEPFDVERVLRVGAQVARALSAAHEAGIVHRDIKPSNVMVRPDGYVKVVDFGLARSASGAATRTGPAEDPLTEAGMLVGTVRYMSPEQARGAELEGSSDVFSLGVVLYELATGTHPFQADSVAEYLQAILSHTPVRADRINPEVPTALADLLHAMMDDEAPCRPTAGEVANSLEGASTGALVASRPARAPTTRHTVGRQRERNQLVEAFDRAAGGHGSFVCITGEPGIGKTTVMDDFLADLRHQGHGCHVARGKCSERLAGTEAYLPVLEALEGLLHAEGGDAVARTMRSVAPSWYTQVAPLAGDDSSIERALREGGGVSQERLKRELGAFLLELSRTKPLVVLLDDVHWADDSTIDLLAYLGLRCADKRALFVLSYRPTDLALANHPFSGLKLDLQARGLCREVPLGFLSVEDVRQYMDLEFPGNDFPGELGDLIHARTEGSPLFMADLLRYLRDREVLVQTDGRWTLGRSLPALRDRLPESVRSMVQRKVDQLDEGDRKLLVACSVQGYEFDAVVVAESLGMDAADVEDRLEALDRVHSFVKEVEEHEFPDRTLTARYRFVHVLYQNALYASLRPTRRAQLSRSVAESLLRHHGEDDDRVAAELALLFESARDFERATRFFLQAARHAVRVFANHEAAKLARRGLDLIPSLPASDERDRRELALLVTLGPPLKDTKGWAVPEVREVYARANELGERIGGTPDFFPALWGMWLAYSSTNDVEMLREMGRRLLAAAEEGGDAGHRLQAHHALTTTCFVEGDFAAAVRHAKEGISLYDDELHHDHAFLYGGHDPGSCCASFAAHSLWMLGYPDQAVAQMRTALEMAGKRGHPVSIALMQWSAGMLYQYRREPEVVRVHAEASQRITLDHGAPIFPSTLLAWVEGQDAPDSSLEKFREELEQRERIPNWLLAYIHALMGEVLATAGRFEEAVESIRNALPFTADGRLGSFVAELHRLEGVFLERSPGAAPEEAERSIRRAIEVAQKQQARMLELRATVSLARLLAPQGRMSEIRPQLEDLYGWFEEGFDTRDLQEAKALLDTSA